MIAERRMLPYTRQLVLLALYDVLDTKTANYHKDAESGTVTAELCVHGNLSGFSVEVKEHAPATELTVTLTLYAEGLSERGKQRAVDFLADSVEQTLENEFKIQTLLGGNL